MYLWTSVRVSIAMTRDEAQREHDAALMELRQDTPLLVPGDWDQPRRVEQLEDSWLFWYVDPRIPGEVRRDAVVVRGDHKGTFIVLGAIGKIFSMHSETIGLPLSNERWLGSGPGRYQLFENGVGVWDRGYVQDLGYPRVLEPAYRAGRDCKALVAIFDLRGFTTTADSQDSAEVQAVIEDLEGAFQVSFARKCWVSVFVKGTGDGLLVVTESEHFRGIDNRRVSVSELYQDHAVEFVDACQRVIRDFRARRRGTPAIGCGIDCGQVKQVFLLGQSDYLGPAVNHAAKIQQRAVDEVRMSTTVRDWLAADGGRGAQLAANTRQTKEHGVLQLSAD
jgi:class 3 adenylate cyclase